MAVVLGLIAIVEGIYLTGKQPTIPKGLVERVARATMPAMAWVQKEVRPAIAWVLDARPAPAASEASTAPVAEAPKRAPRVRRSRAGVARARTAGSPAVPVGTVGGEPASTNPGPLGWLSLSLPFAATVLDGPRRTETQPGAPIELPAGRHHLVVRNDGLGFEAAVDVEVAPGGTTHAVVPLPDGTLQVNAAPWAEVWVDGSPVGETPIGDLRLPIGSHEVRFRHPELGERVRTAEVTATAPARISVDLRP